MSANVDNAHLAWLSQLCNASVSDVKLIQSLWSGYGACFRATLTSPTLAYAPKGVQAKHAVVAKCATPPTVLNHPKGWNGDTSHQRKLASFAIENSFYQHLQPFTTEACKVPRCIASDNRDTDSLLVMEDLAHLGYTKTRDALSVQQAEVVLQWLGAFHGQFLNVTDNITHQGINLWPEGSYWHLATRQDEFNNMPEGPLKDAAVSIANCLSSATYQTLIHGDAKVANFCFTPDMSSCAAVDFQYVGFGVGVKDVAYFLGSALTTQQRRLHGEACLDVYFHALKQALIYRRPFLIDGTTEHFPLSASQADAVEDQWRKLYCMACADFHRFLIGWSPQHWKIDDELNYQTDLALARL